MHSVGTVIIPKSAERMKLVSEKLRSLQRIHPHELGRVQLLLSVKAIAGQAATGGDAIVQAADVAAQQLGLALQPVMSEKNGARTFTMEVASSDFVKYP